MGDDDEDDDSLYVGYTDPVLMSRYEHKLASLTYIDQQAHKAKWNQWLIRDMLKFHTLFLGVSWGIIGWFVYYVLRGIADGQTLHWPTILLISAILVYNGYKLVKATAEDMRDIQIYQNKFMHHARRHDKAYMRYYTAWKERTGK